MGFIETLKSLNQLKKEKVIVDYAIVGGYAVTYYLEPSLTYDLDIIVLLKREADFRAIYEYYRKRQALIKEVHIVVEGLPVQFLPSYISPLFASAVRTAKRITVGGVPTKVVTIQHLIALLLVSFRPKDRIHITELANKTHRQTLLQILGEFEDEKTPLRQRFYRVLADI